MNYKYIKDEVASKVGLTDYANNTNENELLDRRCNSAAQQVWEEKDLPGSLREVYLCVLPQKFLACPSFIGSLRAVRDAWSTEPWTLKDLRPRYHHTPWDDMWKNWRYVGAFPIMRDVSNAAPLTFRIPTIDSTVTVTVVGETADSKNAIDTVTMSATTVTGTKSFSEIRSIHTNKIANENITMEDADGNEMAVIYNDSKDSRYLVYDISKYPGLGDCSDGTKLMEVLYKMRLPLLQDDNDIFPVDGFDDVIVGKTVQLFVELDEGKEKRAAMIDARVSREIDRKILDREGTEDHVINFAPNPLLGMFSRGRAQGQSGRRHSSRNGGYTYLDK